MACNGATLFGKASTCEIQKVRFASGRTAIRGRTVFMGRTATRGRTVFMGRTATRGRTVARPSKWPHPFRRSAQPESGRSFPATYLRHTQPRPRRAGQIIDNQRSSTLRSRHACYGCYYSLRPPWVVLTIWLVLAMVDEF